MEKRIRRNTAYKVWVKDVHKAPEEIDEESGLPYLKLKDKKLVRVNLFGSVVSNASSDSYGSVLLDDSSGSVRLKVWGDDLYLINDKKIGEMVFVVGRYATFDNERYIRPEIVRRVSIDWALLRRMELTKEYGVPDKEDKVEAKIEEEPPKEVEPSLAARETILTLIEKEDEVDEEKLITACDMPKEKVMIAIEELLKEGEIFCPKKGYYRLV